jgi:methylated-DNA-[protein]-cysteine S-methyltransferase
VKPLKETSQKQSAIQERVYRLCAQVPTGFFTTYQAIAKNIDTSPRLVGQALKVNPFPSEVVPCHRVISTNFFIGGFRGQ